MNAPDLLDAIKEHARPTWSTRIDEICQTAETNGWTAEALAAAVNKGIGPQTGTGYVVVTLDKLASTSRQNPTPKPNTPVGHTTCRQHGDPCELCYCHEGQVRHNVSTPAPTWYTDALKAAPTHPGGLQGAMDDGLRSQGIDPDRLRHHLDHGQPGDADAYLAAMKGNGIT